jgi:biotin carboxyl carrier protein
LNLNALAYGKHFLCFAEWKSVSIFARIMDMEAEKYDNLVLEDGSYETLLTTKYKERRVWTKHPEGEVCAALPGEVVEIAVNAGDNVKTGELLITFEAMKMLNRVSAPYDGTIKEINVAKGDKVAKGDILLTMEPKSKDK